MKRREFVSLSSLAAGSIFLPKRSLAADLPEKPLSGHVCLVSGGTSGMGENAVRELSRDGAKVAFCGRREGLGKKIESELNKLGQDVYYIKCDVSDENQVKEFIQKSVDKYKHIDSFYLNAGVAQRPAAFHETPSEELFRVFSINCFGVFYCIKHVLPHMMKRKKGHLIINTSYGVSKGIGGECAYSASKIALNAFVRHLSMDYARYNIKTVSIEPLAVRTPMIENRARFLKKSIDQIGNKLLGRIIEPSEVTEFIKHLLLMDSPLLSGNSFDLSAGVSHMAPWNNPSPHKGS